MTTISNKIKGNRKARSNEDARRGILMSADEVRWYIDQLELKTKDIGARRVIAEGAIKFGNISHDGIIVYQQYVQLLKA